MAETHQTVGDIKKILADLPDEMPVVAMDVATTYEDFDIIQRKLTAYKQGFISFYAEGDEDAIGEPFDGVVIRVD